MLAKEILISKATRCLVNDELIKIGVDGENLQEKLVFKFYDGFVNGQARAEILLQDGTKNYVTLNKVDESYELPIKSTITKKGLNYIELVITEGTSDEDIPVFKSEKIPVYVSESIDAIQEAPEGYDEWIDVANAKLNQIDNFDIEAEQTETGSTITITKKDGTEETIELFNGAKGDKGDKGDTGLTGPTGPAGPQGIQGERGLTGEQGPQGERGEKGDTGSTGATGPAGPKGDTGERGPAGSDGQDGFSPIANVSQSGDVTTISITDKNGTTTADIDLSGVGGTNMEWYGSSYSNPYILSDMKKGIYFPLGVGFYKATSSSAITGYINTTDYGNYCIPYILILNKDVSEAESNEEFGYAIFCINNDINISGAFIAGGKFFGTPIIKKGSVFQIKQYSYSDWKVIYQILEDAVPQAIRGQKTFYAIPEVNSYSAPTTNTQLVAKKYVDDMIASISGGSLVGIITDLLDETYTNRINFKKSKVGTYVNNKGTSIQFINKLADDWSGFSSIDNLETLYVVEDISNITTLESDLIFAYAIVWQFGETLKLMKFTLNTSLLISATQTSLLPQITSLTQSSQQIQGEKTFLTIPKLNGTLTPTQDAHLVNKKYVDDKIGDINTILATLTTPSNNN